MTFLYDDGIPWGDVGRMECKRASDVIFDPTDQRWKIQSFLPPYDLIGSFHSREDAIKMEILLMEDLLKVGPEVVDQYLEEKEQNLRKGSDKNGEG